jgi:hypothetical protein
MALKTVKKVVKKIAKKAAKTTSPRPKRMTAEELTAILAGYSRKMEESHAKTEAIMAKSRAETDKALQELSADIRKTSAHVDELSNNVGGVNRRLGKTMEIIVVPYLRLDLNAKGGHTFEDMRGNRKVNSVVGARKETVAEMDVFLYGHTEAMAAEIKAHLKKSDVEEHLKRLQTLRFYETEAEIKGKKLFGAVIGVIVDNDARKLAKKNGLYVIKIREEEEKLEIDAPEQRRVW